MRTSQGSPRAVGSEQDRGTNSSNFSRIVGASSNVLIRADQQNPRPSRKLGFRD